MYSITMKYWPVRSSRPESNTWTMFGCTRRAAACASRWKRDTNAGSSARCSASSLTATWRSRRRSMREVHRGHAAEAQPALQPVAPGDLDGAHLPPSWPPAPPPPAPAVSAFAGAVRRPLSPPPVAADARRRFARRGRAAAGVRWCRWWSWWSAWWCVASWWCVVVGVVAVVVVVVVVSSSAWCRGVGLRERLRAQRERASCAGCRCPGAACRAGRSRRVAGSALKSCSVLSERCFGRGAVAVAAFRRPARRLRSRSAAARRRRRGSACRWSCRRRRAARRRAPSSAGAAPRAVAPGPGVPPSAAACSLTVLQALGERVGQARRADRGGGAGDVVVGAVEGRGHARRGRAAATTRAGRRRAAARRCRGSAATRPRRRRAACRRGAARRWRARPRGARTTARRASGRSGRCGGAGRRGTARRAAPRARTPRPGRAGWRGRARRRPPRPAGCRPARNARFSGAITSLRPLRGEARAAWRTRRAGSRR